MVTRGDRSNSPLATLTQRPTTTALLGALVTSEAGRLLSTTPISRRLDTNMPPTSNVRPMRWTELSTLVNICDCPIVVASPLACTRARKVNTDDLT